jgi:high-affinity iron transporter
VINVQIGFREGLHVAATLALVGASVPRPWGRQVLVKLGLVLAAALAVSAVLAAVIYTSAAAASDGALHTIDVVLSTFSAATLTTTAIWAARRTKWNGAASAPTSHSAALMVAVVAVVRQTIEITCYVLAANTVTPSEYPVPKVLVGLVVAAAIAVPVGCWLFSGGREHVGYLVTQAALLILAAGMSMSAARSALRAGWLDVVGRPLLEFDFLARPSNVVARLLSSVVGVHPQLTVAEVLTLVIYVSLMVTVCWRVHFVSLRLQLRGGTR